MTRSKTHAHSIRLRDDVYQLLLKCQYARSVTGRDGVVVAPTLTDLMHEAMEIGFGKMLGDSTKDVSS